jgi:hypothetical protein
VIHRGSPVIIPVWRKSRESSSWWVVGSVGRRRSRRTSAATSRSTRVDLFRTIRNLGAALDIPVGALCHYIAAGAKVAGGVTAPRGSSGGVSPVKWIRGMRSAHARLDAYAQLRGLITWLQFPLDQPGVYE